MHIAARERAAAYGLELRAIRETLGLTQTDLGAATGLAQSSIGKIEDGASECRLGTYFSLEAVLGEELARQRKALEFDPGTVGAMVGADARTIEWIESGILYMPLLARSLAGLYRDQRDERERQERVRRAVG